MLLAQRLYAENTPADRDAEMKNTEDNHHDFQASEEFLGVEIEFVLVTQVIRSSRVYTF